ncbi:MAG: alpha/beta hydrolase [Verrucomicrobiales bacterium]|nr:alpha/beta hydrolase [Verrucomicrobiales bacterium]
MKYPLLVVVLCSLQSFTCFSESIFVWPDLAPGETSKSTGEASPPRQGENPPITRLVNIRRPDIDIFLAPRDKANGTGVLVLPGGGFGKVVPDKEGSEAAQWLAEMGISTFVLRYRTNEATPEKEPQWQRPLQDAQRGLRIMRANSEKWNLKKDQIGILAFSAGGQVGAVLHAMEDRPAYKPVDQIDKQSCQTDFSMLIYPWRVVDTTGFLLPEIRFSKRSKPAFIVHTHNDRSSSLGSVLIYIGLKEHDIPAELHIYENGGHGYGMRPVPNSNIASWRDRAADWLKLRKLGTSG